MGTYCEQISPVAALGSWKCFSAATSLRLLVVAAIRDTLLTRYGASVESFRSKGVSVVMYKLGVNVFVGYDLG